MRTLCSLSEVENRRLYTMTYYGGYGFLPKSEEAQKRAMRLFALLNPRLRYPSGPGACSVFAALGDPQHRLYGRNYDWADTTGLLLFTAPPRGYASVAMIDLRYIGFAASTDLLALSWPQRLALLAAPLVVMDGMNERGLTVAVAQVPDRAHPREPGKATVNGPTARRLILDRAGSVEEAIGVLEQYNVSDPDGAGHLLIADPSGKAVVVEYLEGQTKVLPGAGSWQAITNFYLAGENPPGEDWGQQRYAAVVEQLARAQGVLSVHQALEILAAVQQEHTRWSVVYDMSTGEVSVAMDRHYDVVRQFHLAMRQVPLRASPAPGGL
jgi:hypothetical protein